MRITGKILLVISFSFVLLLVSGTLKCKNSNKGIISKTDDNCALEEFFAVNDTFYFVTNCANTLLFDNVLKNDVFQNTDAQICSVFAPKDGVLTFGSNGGFTLTLPEQYSGTLEFSYTICGRNGNETSSEAQVFVIVENDNDCDGVVNDMDLDNDNDGILDLDEGNGLLDSDGDGIPDNFDIDSDNDGISDNEEWQKEGDYIKPSGTDANNNGWDDAYDTDLNGVYYKPTDTDNNGIPDFIDNDSDGDGVSDNLEGFDMDNDGFADTAPIYTDEDNDGLDDAYDLISCWIIGYNSTGSNSPLPDLNKNGIRDWRDNKIQVGNFNSSAYELFIYPNPSTGAFFIQTPLSEKDEEFDLQIINMQGMKIYEVFINTGTSKINPGNISSGNYILHLKSESFDSRSIITVH